MNTSGMDTLMQERNVHYQQAAIIGVGARPSMSSISQVSNGNRGELVSRRQTKKKIKRVNKHDL